MAWIQTYTRVKFDFTDPTPEMITIEDIAHALSNACRWSGHTPFHYSVAQHSLLVADMVQHGGGSDDDIRAGLMHDAHEAYTGDVPTPLKSLLPELKPLQRRIQNAIDERFRLIPEPDIVRTADSQALDYELTFLMGGPAARWVAEPIPMPEPFRAAGEVVGAWPLTHGLAEQRFLRRAAELGIR